MTAIDHRNDSERVWKKIYATDKKTAERIVKQHLKALDASKGVDLITNDGIHPYCKLHLLVHSPIHFDPAIDMDIVVKWFRRRLRRRIASVDDETI